MVELVVIEQAGDVENAWLVRCHAGSLRVGQRLSRAVDPEGVSVPVDLECTEIRIYEDIVVDELEANFGGRVILRGHGVELVGSRWMLASNGAAS